MSPEIRTQALISTMIENYVEVATGKLSNYHLTNPPDTFFKYMNPSNLFAIYVLKGQIKSEMLSKLQSLSFSDHHTLKLAGDEFDKKLEPTFVKYRTMYE